jgi:hypothetical protein
MLTALCSNDALYVSNEIVRDQSRSSRHGRENIEYRMPKRRSIAARSRSLVQVSATIPCAFGEWRNDAASQDINVAVDTCWLGLTCELLLGLRQLANPRSMMSCLTYTREKLIPRSLAIKERRRLSVHRSDLYLCAEADPRSAIAIHSRASRLREGFLPPSDMRSNASKPLSARASSPSLRSGNRTPQTNPGRRSIGHLTCRRRTSMMNEQRLRVVRCPAQYFRSV